MTYVRDADSGQEVVFTDGTNYFKANDSTGEFHRVVLTTAPTEPRRIPVGVRNLSDIDYFAPKA